jgi:hypothetical protein
MRKENEKLERDMYEMMGKNDLFKQKKKEKEKNQIKQNLK